MYVLRVRVHAINTSPEISTPRQSPVPSMTSVASPGVPKLNHNASFRFGCRRETN